MSLTITRKIFYLAFICVSVWTTSCKKTDTSTPPTSNPPVVEQPPIVDPIKPAVVVDGITIPAKAASIPSTIQHLTFSDDYKVEVKKTGTDTYYEVAVYKTDNYVPPASNSSDRRPQTAASFANFSFETGTSVDVRVTMIKPNAIVNSYVVRPVSYNIAAAKPAASQVTFTLNRHRKVFVEINGDAGRNNPLFVFGNPPEPAKETATGGGTTYNFEPGTITDIGFRKVIKSNDRINIRAGAIVQGTFLLDKRASNIKFIGHGMLTSGNIAYGSNPNTDVVKKCTFAGAGDFYSGVSNVTWQGLTILNAAGWVFGCTMGWDGDTHLSHHNTFKDLKEIHWNAQTDVLWFDGDNNATDDCFFFTNDDLTTHGSNDCTISNIVYWQGRNGGHLFMQDNWSSSNNITYDGVDVIGTDNTSRNMIELKASQTKDVTVNNITFKNINIESRAPQITSYWTGRFISMYVKSGSSANNWVFDNIKIANKHANEGVFNPDGAISNIKFKNFFYGGTKVNSLAESNITVNSNVTGITYE